MTDFDPTRIVTLAQALTNGTTEEKIAALEGLGDDPLATGVLFRALDDREAEVRRVALERLQRMDVRPPDAILGPLLGDVDPEVRALATALQDLPEAPNPMEQLIPLVESMADQLGPLGGLLRGMMGTLRDVGADDEKTQLLAVRGLAAGNPAAFLAIQQALRSPHLAVRLVALEKALELPDVTVPNELVGPLLADPNSAVRDAAQALVSAGRVAPFDEDTFREQTMKTLMGGLAGGMGMSPEHLGNLMKGQFADMMGGAGGGMPDLSSLFGGGSGPSPGAGAPGTSRPTPQRPTPPPSEPTPAPRVETDPHRAAGHVYIVGDERTRDRLLQSIARFCEPGSTLAWHTLIGFDGPGHWAYEIGKARPSSPGWPESLREAGAPLTDGIINGGDIARRISEQVWGAAFADHGGDDAITLVFHDGMLSRAAWRDQEWSDDGAETSQSASAPMALLRAFLTDPTDDTLAKLDPAPRPLAQKR